ncbi:hypothetical protein SEPCBS57363_001997 [Sporothrix epigloea]|uniref:DUF7770 domain-containing protein n=1 Tax=Sporothrix epigloea TaxID=1892477 RepID=A0ABP0DGM5_9PEZI
MDNNFDSDKLESEDLAKPVLNVHLIAYINPGNEGDGEIPPTNHWAVFLELSKDRSVRVDMMPGYGLDGRRGKVDLSTKEYAFTKNSIQRLTFEPRGHPNVEVFIKSIGSLGLQRYNFTKDCEGCRFWCYQFIKCLEGISILEPGSAAQTHETIGYYYCTPTGKEPREVGEGEFRLTE